MMILMLVLAMGLLGNTRVPEEYYDDWEPDLKAIVTMINWDQWYYSCGEWSIVVNIYFEIENTSSVPIDYYEVYFIAVDIDGNQYIELANGGPVFVGETITDWTVCGVNKIEVISVSIQNYRLKRI